ncbi:MAG: hypothetical protein H6722_13310 [Sandaracinus sp.]|nr:hypothetical protein [Myxococcales bacterium]MCB9613422.1 hypothetical protein [Sandaracinus sp.]
MDDPSPTGALFFAASDALTANVILKKLREDGKHNRTSAKKPSGFGDDGLVGLAIHPPKNGWWAVRDSADGAPGIASGEWSTVSILANHHHSTALWTRAWGDELAIAVELVRGGSFFQTYVGTRAEVDAFVDARGIDRAHARAPKEAGDDATLATIRYEPAKYRSGPDAPLVRSLLALRHALQSGDTAVVRTRFGALAHEHVPFGLAVMRALDDDATHATFAALAHELLAKPPMLREKPLSRMTFEEEVMRRVAERTDDESFFVACLDRLETIEGDAQRRTSHAHPAGVIRMAFQFWQSAPARAFACLSRVIARDDAPDWRHVNYALSAFLTANPGPVRLEGDGDALVRHTLARLPALGVEAARTVRYNLACVYARAGQLEEALATLAKAGDLRVHNPRPEADTDLEPLWKDPRFLALLAGKSASEAGVPVPSDVDTPLEELDLSDEAKEALASLELSTVAELVAITDPSGLPRMVVAELIEALAEIDVEWSPTTTTVPCDPPEERRVPRLEIDLEEGTESDVSSRLGGLPSAPSVDFEWPCSESRPMDFVLQIVGKAGGGEVELGDVHVLQVFADLEGEFYEDDWAIVMHREPCPAVLEAPVGVDVTPIRRMRFTEGFDDRILTDLEWPDDDDPLYDEHQAAHSHAWVDKVWGIPVAANLDAPSITDSEGQPMRCLLALSCVDDWFLWHVFVREDFAEAQVVAVR